MSENKVGFARIMRKMSLIALRADAWRFGVTWLSVSMLSACSAIETHAPHQLEVAMNESVVSAPAKPEAIKLTADQVYRVLAAESLYLRGETASAAQVYIDLAQRYGDAGLAQRAYDLSAHSGNAQLLGRASQLNTEINPNRIESWQVQVVLALRANDVEKAWQAWRSFYQQGLAKGSSEKSLYMATATLAQDDLSVDTLIAFSARIAQEQPSPYAEFLQVMFLASANRLSDAYQRLMQALQTYADQPELAQMLASFLKQEFNRNLLTKLVALIALPVLKNFKSHVDHRRYNGATLLGLKGIVVKSHGSADVFSFTNALERAAEEARTGVLARITERVAMQHPLSENA